MNKIAICSISSKNYFAFAKTLFQSIKKLHTDVDCHFLLADEIDGEFIPSELPFTILEANQLGIVDFELMSFTYDVVEFNTALKPFFIQYLLEKGYEKVIYLDPDIMVYNSLKYIFDLLDKYSIILTPHITSPINKNDQLNPQEQGFLSDGSYNLGFIAVSKSENVDRFVRWWEEKLLTTCYREIETGLFVDQKWINLVPSLFNDVYILRNVAYNMAYWNLHERTIENGLVNGKESLCFYHFSGLDIYNINEISKYQNRYNLQIRADLLSLFISYQEAVISNGQESSKEWTYKYGQFENGEKIGLLARRLYPTVTKKYSRPFSVEQDSYYRLLRKKKILESNLFLAMPKQQVESKAKYVNNLLKFSAKIIGIDRYNALMKYMRYISVMRRQKFLLDE